MKTHNNFLITAFLAIAFSQTASAQSYVFHEVPSGISLFSSASIYSVTDNGDYFIVLGAINGPNSAFIYNGHTLTAITAQTGDSFYAMNNSETVIGQGNAGAFIQDKAGKRTLIAPPSGETLFVYNLNNLNVAVGQIINSPSTQSGFSWKAGVLSPYMFPGANITCFNGNNDVGDYVGFYTLASNNITSAFHLTKAGKATVITVPTYDNVTPSMINNAGLVVGYAEIGNAQNGQVGFTSNKAGKVAAYDLGNAAPIAMPGAKGPLLLQKQLGITFFWGVNNNGWIGGSYTGYYENAVGGYTISIPMIGLP